MRLFSYAEMVHRQFLQARTRWFVRRLYTIFVTGINTVRDHIEWGIEAHSTNNHRKN